MDHPRSGVAVADEPRLTPNPQLHFARVDNFQHSRTKGTDASSTAPPHRQPRASQSACFKTLHAMNTTQRSLSLLAISAAAFMLAACDQSQPPTVGEKIDAGIARTQEAATEAKKDMQAAGSEMKQDMQAAGSEIKQEASQAGAALADGAADITITTKVKAALAADDQLSALAISVNTTNKVVTLTGPAPTQAAFDRASAMAQAVDGVSEVKNQLTVAGKN